MVVLEVSGASWGRILMPSKITGPAECAKKDGEGYQRFAKEVRQAWIEAVVENVTNQLYNVHSAIRNPT